MIVRSIDQISGTDRTVKAKTWESRRLILARDRVGFSLHDTVLYAGTTTDMWYANHVEAVYCVAGSGQLINKETGETYDIAPGTMYLLNGNERHTLTCHTDLNMVCVFNPPLAGPETHDANGTYPLMTESVSEVAS
ncbi:MAG: ectoine synthase [Nocardiaceae bacterium]|nr:ectoine synthase [Nocardiaceae bacterium]